MHPDNVGILSPEKEGGYTWTSINYVENVFQENAVRANNGYITFQCSLTIYYCHEQNLRAIILLQKKLSMQSERKPTWGSMDLGGASMQFALETPKGRSDLQPTLSVRAFGQDHNLLTWSFLCYGTEEALRRYRSLLISSAGYQELTPDPCLPINVDPIALSYADLFQHPCSKVEVPNASKKV